MTIDTDGGQPERPERNEGDWWTHVAQRQYDSVGTVGLVVEIVYAIAAARGVEPTEITSPTLYECADVAAIKKSLFDPTGCSRDNVGVIKFCYAELLVTVDSSGWIHIYESANNVDKIDGENEIRPV